MQSNVQWDNGEISDCITSLLTLYTAAFMLFLTEGLIAGVIPDFMIHFRYHEAAFLFLFVSLIVFEAYRAIKKFKTNSKIAKDRKATLQARIDSLLSEQREQKKKLGNLIANDGQLTSRKAEYDQCKGTLKSMMHT